MKSCPACGASDLPRGVRFCPMCGHAMEPVAAPGRTGDEEAAAPPVQAPPVSVDPAGRAAMKGGAETRSASSGARRRASAPTQILSPEEMAAQLADHQEVGGPPVSRAVEAGGPTPAQAGRSSLKRGKRRTEIIPQSEIEKRLDEIRARLVQAEAASGGHGPAGPAAPVGKVRPRPATSGKKKPFSETLWFMQVQDPDHMIVDSDEDVTPEDLTDRYRKKETLEIDVRKAFSLNVGLDDHEAKDPTDAPPPGEDAGGEGS